MSVMGCSWTHRGASWPMDQLVREGGSYITAAKVVAPSWSHSCSRSVGVGAAARSARRPGRSFVAACLTAGNLTNLQRRCGTPISDIASYTAHARLITPPLQNSRLLKLRREVFNVGAVTYWWKDVDGDGRFGYRSSKSFQRSYMQRRKPQRAHSPQRSCSRYALPVTLKTLVWMRRG